MTEKEISELYVRLAFQYESAIDTLLTKGLIDTDLATTAKEKFYDSLNEEKLWTAGKVSLVEINIKAIFQRITWICYSKLDAQSQHIGISTSMGK